MSGGLDSSDNVFAAGEIGAGTYDFGNGATVASAQGNGNHVALVKYNASGSTQWARSSVNDPSIQITFASVTVDATDSVYAAGFVAGTGVVDFGNNVTATGTEVPNPGCIALLVKYQ